MKRIDCITTFIILIFSIGCDSGTHVCKTQADLPVMVERALSRAELIRWNNEDSPDFGIPYPTSLSLKNLLE